MVFCTLLFVNWEGFKPTSLQAVRVNVVRELLLDSVSSHRQPSVTMGSHEDRLLRQHITPMKCKTLLQIFHI